MFLRFLFCGYSVWPKCLTPTQTQPTCIRCLRCGNNNRRINTAKIKSSGLVILPQLHGLTDVEWGDNWHEPCTNQHWMLAAASRHASLQWHALTPTGSTSNWTSSHSYYALPVTGTKLSWPEHTAGTVTCSRLLLVDPQPVCLFVC